MQDWRLTGQERHLTGARVRRLEYRPSSETWDHDHCEFCRQKVMVRNSIDGAGADTVGWQTEDEYRWICDECFADFHERFGFVAMHEGSPTRGVELHDATVLEVTDQGGLVVVCLQAFVHDDLKSESLAGCWQRIDLGFYEATNDRRGSGEPWVLDGSVRVDEELFDNMLPLPLHRAGTVMATLKGADFELTVQARRVWLGVAGAPGEREGGSR
jgi:hypothetical protein